MMDASVSAVDRVRDEECIRTRHTAPMQDIIVWDAMGYDRKSLLVCVRTTITSACYVNDISLRPVDFPNLEIVPQAIFQQHNARPHVAATRTFLKDNNVQLLSWPTRLPDLSPIEKCMGHAQTTNAAIQYARKLINFGRG
ncbi:transposable element tcb2 transposase [Lasius niger]|uniref:Transposable element tcb2 transposase n=1 Tax=Lasius niger TaxID=67767 RepID=A0A0J7KIS0_LASNI|nr:transposable element tcb2 transposase [Lasius niger]